MSKAGPKKRGLYTSISLPLARRLARAAKEDDISQTSLIAALIEKDMDRRDRLKASRTAKLKEEGVSDGK